DDSVCDDLFLGETISIDFRGQEGLNEPFSRMLLDFSDRRFEILRHFLDRTAHPRKVIGVVLKVPEHFGEILRPYLQLRSILYRDSQHFRSDDVWERLSEISDYIYSPTGRDVIDESLHYITDVASQDLHTLGCKC